MSQEGDREAGVPGAGVSRRIFLKRGLLAAGAMAVSAPLIPAVSRKREAAQPANPSAGQRKVRAWTMVIDLKKCDGCVTIGTNPLCTQACINGHFSPKGQRWIEVFERKSEGHGTFFMPTPCMQCENAPCVNVCPVAATYHNQDGIVLIDHNRCIGCRLCMAACPYQRRFFNWGDPQLPPEAAFAEYSPEYPVPARKGTVIKCMFCAHMLRNGRLPYCVSGCPMQAIYMGDLNEDVATNGIELVKLTKFLHDNDAFRWKPELGTQTRVYYLPGHGQNFGRHAGDSRPLKPAEWNYGGPGFDNKPGIWPWGGEAK